jgi:hypothetical protein
MVQNVSLGSLRATMYELRRWTAKQWKIYAIILLFQWSRLSFSWNNKNTIKISFIFYPCLRNYYMKILLEYYSLRLNLNGEHWGVRVFLGGGCLVPQLMFYLTWRNPLLCKMPTRDREASKTKQGVTSIVTFGSQIIIINECLQTMHSPIVKVPSH